MKNKYFLLLILLFLFFLNVIIVLVSCTKQEKINQFLNTDEYYTCSMDPQVAENKPGNCPICHMTLIKVKKNSLQEGQIRLSEQQIQLGNIQLDTARLQSLAKEITLSGLVAIDQNLSVAISAKIPGRIEQLAVKNVGDYIKKEQLMYKIYSEDLVVSQQEYLIAIQKQPPMERIAEAAINKLRLYGMSEAQLNNLKNSKQAIPNVPYFASENGYITEISATEGNYVAAGTVLFRIAALNSLWVEAQVYFSFLPFLKNGIKATFYIPASGEKRLKGNVVFIDPQVQTPNRFVLARFQITNFTSDIKPGMMAYITLQTSKIKALAIPVDAVIQTDEGTNVWVRKIDGSFENKMVITGTQNSTLVEIKSGLKPGDVVVITGAYLLNSEYIFKRGTHPMTGHSHPQ